MIIISSPPLVIYVAEVHLANYTTHSFRRVAKPESIMNLHTLYICIEMTSDFPGSEISLSVYVLWFKFTSGSNFF